MRLLLASAVADSPSTGMGKWAHRVGEALEQRGHRVTVWFGRDVVGTAPGTFGTIVAYPIQLARLIVARRHDFDAVIVHEPGGFWYGLARQVLSSLPPLIAMCHNVESKCFEQRLRGAHGGYSSVPWATRLKQPLFRNWQSNGTIRLADHVICLSTEDRGYLIRSLHLNPARVTRMVNGVAPEDFAEAAADRARSALFVGGWLEVKGARMVPVIFRQLRQRLGDARLTIAGAGVANDVVLGDFEPDDRDHVRVMPGPLDAAAIRHAYRSHAVFFMPSMSEGSPLSLLEAMAAGAAVVAAHVGGIPDIVRDGTDGLLFDPAAPGAAADALSRVLGDPVLARSLGEAARQRACGFTWNATATSIEQAVRNAATRA